MIALLWLVGCAERLVPSNPMPLPTRDWREDAALLGWAGSDLVLVSDGALLRVGPTGNLHATLLTRPALHGVGSVSHDGRIAVGVAGGILLVDREEATRNLDVDGVVKAVAFSADGTTVAAVADAPLPAFQPPVVPTVRNRAFVTAWNLNRDSEPRSWVIDPCHAQDIAFTGTDEILVACRTGLVRLRQAGTTRVDLQAERVAAQGTAFAVADLRGVAAWVDGRRVVRTTRRFARALAYTPSGSLWVGSKGSVEEWVGTTRTRSWDVAGTPSRIATDGTTLAVGGPLLTRWNLATGTQLAALPPSPVVAVAVTEDSARVVFARATGDVRVVDRATGTQLAVWWMAAAPSSVAIAGDQVAALVGSRIQQWTVGKPSAAPGVNKITTWTVSACGLQPGCLPDRGDVVFPVSVACWASSTNGFVSGSTDGTLTWWSR